MKKCLFFFLAPLLFGYMHCLGQPYTYSFEHYTVDQGLSHNMVGSIFKDHLGYMWFGTSNGLNRFDGYSFQTFYHQAEGKSLPSKTIKAISEDSTGCLWISTEDGICRLDRQRRHFEIPALPPLEKEEFFLTAVSNLAVESADSGWFARGIYLYHLDLHNFCSKRYRMPVTLADGNSILLDHQKKLWLILQGSSYRFDPISHTFRYFGGRNELHTADNRLLMRARYAGGQLTFASWGNGLWMYDEAKDSLINLPFERNGIIVDIAYVHEGNKQALWMAAGAHGLGLYRLNDGSFYEFAMENTDPLSHNNTMAHVIYNDSANHIIWIGTEGGIEKYDERAIRFQRIHYPRGFIAFSQASTSAVIPDATDITGRRYWIAVWAGGLIEWNSRNNTFQHWLPQQGLLSTEIFDMLQDKQGKLWLAERGGVQVFDPRTKHLVATYRNFLKTPNVTHKILRLFEDHEGNIWMISNHDGLFRYSRKDQQILRWNIFSGTIEIPYQLSYIPDPLHQVSDVGEDMQHNIWATSPAGLFRVNPATCDVRQITNRSRHGSKLSADNLGPLCISRSGHIWVASRAAIAELDQNGEVIKEYNGQNGLRCTEITQIIEDSKGFIWCATNNYLHRLDPISGRFLYFGKEDGLMDNAIGGAISMIGDGNLAVGFSNSFCMINATNFPLNTRKPEIEITSLTVGQQPRYLDDKGTLTLQPTDAMIRFDFSPLNYTQPQKNLFAFKLDSQETNWHYTSEKGFMLMKMSSGRHYLLVKARNNDGVWGTPKLVTVNVLPAFNETWWFKILVVAALFTVFYLANWLRLQQRNRLDKIRNRIAKDLHDDIGSTLSSIRIMSQVVRTRSQMRPDTGALLQKIETDAEGLSENMQDIVWTIKTQNNSVSDVLTRMREYASKVLEAKGIAFSFSVYQGFESLKLDIARKRNIYLIFKEAINNAVKYSECTRIILFITKQKGYLKMVIEDNGKGFDLSAARKGNGLNNLQKRAAELKGRLQITSQEGKGTRIDLMLKY